MASRGHGEVNGLAVTDDMDSKLISVTSAVRASFAADAAIIANISSLLSPHQLRKLLILGRFYIPISRCSIYGNHIYAASTKHMKLLCLHPRRRIIYITVGRLQRTNETVSVVYI